MKNNNFNSQNKLRVLYRKLYIFKYKYQHTLVSKLYKYHIIHLKMQKLSKWISCLFHIDNTILMLNMSTFRVAIWYLILFIIVEKYSDKYFKY